MAQDAKKGFLLYYDYRKHLALLSDEDRGKLLMALLNYGERGDMPEDLDGMAFMAFSFITGQMDRDAQKYADTCRKRSEAGKQGGRPKKETGKQDKAKKANGYSEKQTEAKKGDTEKETDTETVTETDTEKGKESSTPYPLKGGQQDPVPYSKIVDLYHAICISYPKLRAVEGNREKQIAARWKKYKTLDAFRELFEKAEASDFLKGENDRAWTADFDWLIRPTNMSKVLEGKYDGSTKPKTGTAQSQTGGKPSTMDVLAGIIADEEGGGVFD